MRKSLTDKIARLRTSIRELGTAQPGDAEEIRDMAVSAFEDVLEVLEHIEDGFSKLT